jgi:hypothetical protein
MRLGSLMVRIIEGVNAPGVEPVKHEQEDEDDQPQIGGACIFTAWQAQRGL